MRLYACLGSGNCFKPWLVLTQLGRAFDLTLIDVLQGEQKSPSYLTINPQGVVPYLIDEGGSKLGESNAMAWYLAEGSYLMPKTALARAEALQWMFFEQSKLEPFISPARFFLTIVPQDSEARAEDITKWQALADSGLARLDAHLAKSEFMVSTGYSVADVAVFGYVHVLEDAGLLMSDYPSIGSWVTRVGQTRGYRPLSEMGQHASEAA